MPRQEPTRPRREIAPRAVLVAYRILYYEAMKGDHAPGSPIQRSLDTLLEAFVYPDRFHSVTLYDWQNHVAADDLSNVPGGPEGAVA